MDFYRGRRALVTGASAGIGESIARRLAAAGCHLLLAARRLDRLEALAGELAARHGVEVRAVPADLSLEGGAAGLYAKALDLGPPPDILVNNAGVGINRRFLDAGLEEQLAMLRLNALSLTELTRRAAADMADNPKGGGILLVSSVLAFTPCPNYAAYAASKAYVLSLGEALHYELKPAGVRVTTLCPGPTRTEFFDAAGGRASALVERLTQDPDAVARAGLRALARGQSVAVSGAVNRLLAGATRLAPKRLLMKSTDRMSR